jgi:TolB-like protein/tetratricopeptide (TPR) repeat protein
MFDTEAKWDTKAVEDQLQRILGSRLFLGSRRSQDFLRYVVEKSLAGSTPKEYAIAVDVFDRETGYDPAVDATVRVEAGRLRSRLRDYYDTEGKDDPIGIAIPKGSYAAVFTARDSAAIPPPATTPAAEPSLPPAPPQTATAPRSSWRLALFSTVALLLIALAAWLWHRHSLQQELQPSKTQQISLAVLPFVDETGDSANTYLIDGLSDGLIRQLSEIHRLKLISRSAVYRFQSRARNAVAIGRTLGVSTVLAGEVRRIDGKLEVDTELSNVKDGSVIASHQYLPESLDLRPVQASIIQDVIRGLNIDLDSRQSARTMQPVTSSNAAYQQYLRGESAARGTSPSEIHEAIGYFEEAVRLDPSFSLAWADLGQSHLLLGIYFEDPRQHMPLASEYARKALQLDSSLREAHGTLGLVHLLYDWDYPAAVSELSSAENEQSAITVLSCTSHLLIQTGHTRDADELIHRMLGYDPQSAALIGELGCVDYYRGDYDGAIRHYREAMNEDPHSPVPYWGLGKSLSLSGSYDQATQAMREFKTVNGFEPPLLTAEIGYSLAMAGRKREAQAQIDELVKESRTHFVDPYLVSLIYLGGHDEEQTLRWLNRAYQVRSPFLISIPTEPKWKDMLQKPPLQHFVARLVPDPTRTPRSPQTTASLSSDR